MKKTPDFRIFAVVTGVIILGGAALMSSQASTLGDEQSKESALRSDLKNDVELKKMLVDSMAKLQSTRESLAHLEKGVPEYAYLATMLRELEETGKKSGITILGVAQKPRVTSAPKEGAPAPEKKPYIEQDIEVMGKGSYMDAIHCVQALNKFPKVVAARTVVIQPKVSQHDEHALDITIVLRTFMFPEKPKPAGGSTAMIRHGEKHEG